MSFSSGLRITDLNDYLAPEQDCIKPVSLPKKAKPSFSFRDNNTIDQVGGISASLGNLQPLPTEEAKINLADCLACSGCVTTAETVLINLQSHQEVIKHLTAAKENPNAKRVVFTLSPQTRASLGVKYQKSPLLIASLLTEVLIGAGASSVLDLNFARQFMQIEAANEFIMFKKSKSPDDGPLISSWCPGVVCYAEKSQHSLIPRFSKVKSPQQIMGSFVKSVFSKNNRISPSDIYHVAVMPCFDKKLEASRPEFAETVTGNRDVDIVISTLELENLLNDMNINNLGIPDLQVNPNCFLSLDGTFGFDICNPGIHPSFYLSGAQNRTSAVSTAGGTLEFVLSSAAKQIYGIEISPNDLNTPSTPANSFPSETHPLIQIDFPSRNKSKDFKEITINIPNSTEKLVGASVYGFRHLQTIIRKLNSKISKKYDYIEIAACPGACGNGGGQIKPQINTAPNSVKLNLASAVDSLYKSSEASKIPSAFMPEFGTFTVYPNTLELHQKHPLFSPEQQTYIDSNNPNLQHIPNSTSFNIGHRNSELYSKFMLTSFRALEKQSSKITTSW
ncbi:hypothetical protein BB560_004627 [Smittium megazygosporum]|uniref:Iron hydrogenase large subunit C-terminal domain-containing protein n=1 Tax=Smittium megazygosporum TaxID=133381 RepID=A0A2T9Z8P9_9FUNG|nr:hypothetical protein BB560_004627 [Smittium megazygosporum]